MQVKTKLVVLLVWEVAHNPSVVVQQVSHFDSEVGSLVDRLPYDVPGEQQWMFNQLRFQLLPNAVREKRLAQRRQLWLAWV